MIGITTLWVHFLTVIVDVKQTFCYNTHMDATRNGRRFVPRFRGHGDPLSIHMTLYQGSSTKEGMPMSISDLLSVLSFGLACFSAGYAFGKDKNTKK